MKLVHTFGRHAGAVRNLDKDVVRFGRAPDGDVVFDAEFDRDASGNHAEARREGPGWVLVDLKSRNGTFVNGERVERRSLASGDEITFGAKGPRVRVEFGPAGKKPIPPTGTQPAPPLGAEPSAAYASGQSAAFASGRSAAHASGQSPAYASGQSAAFASAQPAPPPAPSPSYAAVQPAPKAGQRVGQRTIAALITSAVANARGNGSQQMNNRVLSEYVDRQVGVATAGQRRTTLFLAFLLFASLAGLAGLVVWSQWSNDEIDRLRSELANLPPNDPHRKEIEGRLGTLHPNSPSFGRSLYDQNKKGIFMLASGGQGFCTAFAVRPSVLATNAHCVIAARAHGGTIVALENGAHGDVSFPVADMRTHPNYREGDAHSLTPDVGIVMISGRSAVVLPMASAQELSSLGAGDDVGLIGFPGRLMDASNPVATFFGAHVGRITNSAGRPGAFADAWLVQHDAPTTHGTSGSPIFNGKGHVVAINAGGYLEGDEETVAGRKTEVVKSSPYKFGMRIDLVNAILR